MINQKEAEVTRLKRNGSVGKVLAMQFNPQTPQEKPGVAGCARNHSAGALETGLLTSQSSLTGELQAQKETLLLRDCNKQGGWHPRINTKGCLLVSASTCAYVQIHSHTHDQAYT